MLGFRLYINNQEVDLKSDFPLSFNAQINDIREPDKRTTTHSKTITIPASKNNVELFSYIYDIHGIVDTSGVVNYTPDFNPNLKASALALFDGVEVFNGIAQLTEIHITDNDDIEFDIVLLGQLINLYDKISDNELTDLDFSEYNHDYTTANVEASWSNSSGYCYPMIEYGNSNNLSNFALNNMYPAIFVKQYIDKIFSDAGCTYTSDFFDSAFFQTLIIPFNGTNFNISSTEITNRKFRASRLTSDSVYSVTSAGVSSTMVFNDDSTVPNFDNSAQYSTANGFYVVGTGLQGTFNLTAFLDITATYTPDTAAIAMVPTQVIIVDLTMVRLDASNNVISYLNTYQIRIRPNGFDVTTSYETSSPYSPSNGDYLATHTGQIYLQSGEVTLNEGEKVGIAIRRFYTPSTTVGGLVSLGRGSGVGGTWSATDLFLDASDNVYGGTYDINANIGSYFLNNVADASYVEGLPIEMSNAVPKGIKQKDFLNGIIKMFNLYLEQDKELSNNFIVEPRDDYYYDTIGNGTWMDLSEKLDISKPLDIEPMGVLDAKKYIFKYKEDKDYFNQDYINHWGETYSERQIDIVNDFIKGEKKTEILFSATPSVGSPSIDRVIPRILNYDIQTGNVSPITSNIRILIWSGLKDTNQSWTITDSAGLHTYTQYPYCGMLDDPYNPTVSLDWEVPDEIYWTSGSEDINYTNKNLYNNYYKKFITEVTDRNSKIVKGWFDIRPFDYSELDFRKLYYFEGEYFRLNKVINYNPISDNLTQLEFVKINLGITTAFTITQADSILLEDLKPRFKPQFTKGNNLTPINVLVSGENNRIGNSVMSGVINGRENTVGEWCDYVNITGDGNLVGGYSSGVTIIGDGNGVTGSKITLINTYDKVINTSNSTYIQGRAVGGDASVSLVTSNKTVLTTGDDDATTYLCDATSGNITISLPAIADFPIGIPLTFKKIDAGVNTVTLNADGSETIDNALTYVLTTDLEAVTIINDGAEWWVMSDKLPISYIVKKTDYNNIFLLMGG